MFAMATVQTDILEAFFGKLAKTATIDPPTIDALRKTLTTAKKLKVDHFVTILAKDATGNKP